MCDTMAIVERDRVLFAKNSDRDPNEAQLLEWHPRRVHAVGDTVRCTWMEISQARETYATLLSRPFWMWGAEMGANEHGVVAGNEAVFTRQPYSSIGLTGMDLLRLGLERSETAKSACEMIISLLERYGQGGGCGHERRGFTYHNSFIVADPREAFVLETAGRLHAVERIEGRRSISNGLSIPGFAEAQADAIRTRFSGCHLRQARTSGLLKEVQGPGGLFQVLRDHGAGRLAPRYQLVNGGMSAPCMHAGGVVAAAQTTASWVSELVPGACRHWVTATSAPCTSLFKPIQVEQPLDLGRAPEDRADESFWWNHERFHRRVLATPEAAFPLFSGERDALEAGWLARPPEPAAAFAVHRARVAEWTRRLEEVRNWPTRPRFVARYWRIRDRRAGLR